MSERIVDFVLEWKDPPPSRKGNHSSQNRNSHVQWVSHLIPLRERPGEWAEVARCFSAGPLSAMAASIAGSRQGSLWKALGPWEATTRFQNGDDYASLYVRWIGEKP